MCIYLVFNLPTFACKSNYSTMLFYVHDFNRGISTNPLIKDVDYLPKVRGSKKLQKKKQNKQ